MIKDLWNVPNVVSLIRLVLIPVFVWLVVAENFGWAGLLLGFIGATDWIDGFLARRLNQVTEVGKLLDPVADRAAVFVAVVAGMVTGVLPAWFAWALIVREGLIGIGALYGMRHGVTKLDVRFLGKTATLMLYFSITGFFVGTGFTLDWLVTASYVIGVPGLVMYYWVGVEYLGDMRSAIAAAK